MRGIQNAGTVKVPSSKLIFGFFEGTIDGNYVVSPGASIEIMALSTPGLSLADGTTISGGSVTVDNGSGSGIGIDGNVSIDNLELDAPAAIQGPGQLTINKSFTWNGGTLGSTGTFVIGSGGVSSFTGSGGTEILDNATLTLNGPMTDANTTGTSLTLSEGATLNNNAAFSFTNDSSLLLGTGATASIVNGSAGSITKICCAGVSHVGEPVTGNGGVAVNSGTLSFDSATGLANASSIQIAPGATLAVTGGSYTQTPAGTLSLEIGGLSPPGQFGRLAVQGAAALAGTLKIGLVDGYLPANSDSFGVVTAGSRNGAFTSVDQSPVDGGTFQVTYPTAGVTLIASSFQPTPTPSPTPAISPTPSSVRLFLPFAPNR